MSKKSGTNKSASYAKKMAELKLEAKELHQMLESNVEMFEDEMEEEEKDELYEITKEIHRIRKALRDKIKDENGNMIPRPNTKEYYDDIKNRLQEEMEAINDLFDPIIEEVTARLKEEGIEDDDEEE